MEDIRFQRLLFESAQAVGFLVDSSGMRAKTALQLIAEQRLNAAHMAMGNGDKDSAEALASVGIRLLNVLD